MAIISSVQSGTIAHTGTSDTATISSVDTSKSIVLNNGWTDPNVSSSDIEENMVRLDLQNATTVRARRDTDGGSSPTVYFSVIEFDEIVDSVQEFEITLTSAASGTATISSVDTSRSVVIYLGLETTESADDWNQALARLDLTNATTVTATRSDTTNDITINGVVVEFASSAIDSVQQGTVSIGVGNTTATDTITSADTARSVLIDNGSEFTGTISDTAPDAIGEIQFTNSTTITAGRSDNEGTLERNYTVIEFVSGVLESVVHDTGAITGTSDTETFTAVDTNFTVVNYLNRRPSITSTEHDENSVGIELTNSTTLTAFVANSGGTISPYSFEVWEFVDGTLGGGGAVVGSPWYYYAQH